jgi:hypothetical protein
LGDAHGGNNQHLNNDDRTITNGAAVVKRDAISKQGRKIAA